MLAKRSRDPFRHLASDLDWMFQSFFDAPRRTARPSIALWEDDEAYHLTAEVPGLTAGDIDLSIDDHLLTLKGEFAAATADEASRLHRDERTAGPFERRIELPLTIAADGVEATVEDGVLRARLPKALEHRARRIEVK